MADMTLSIRDSVLMSEGCRRPDISRSISDSITPSGQISHYGDALVPKTVTESISASGVISKTVFDPRGTSESITFSDQKNNNTINDPPYVQAVNISEAISKTVIDDKVSSDSVSLSSAMKETASLTILYPLNLSSVVRNDAVLFLAMATDLLTGSDISDSLVKWISSIDGLIGYGKSFSYSMLTAGTHTISLTATGHVGVKFATITVTEDTAPSRPENLDEE